MIKMKNIVRFGIVIIIFILLIGGSRLTYVHLRWLRKAKLFIVGTYELLTAEEYATQEEAIMSVASDDTMDVVLTEHAAAIVEDGRWLDAYLIVQRKNEKWICVDSETFAGVYQKTVSMNTGKPYITFQYNGLWYLYGGNMDRSSRNALLSEQGEVFEPIIFESPSGSCSQLYFYTSEKEFPELYQIKVPAS